MRGKGIRAERETVICFNEEDQLASVWTASGSVYRRLRKLGYVPTEDNDRSAKFEMPKRDIKLPRPKNEKRSQASRKRAKALGNTLSKVDIICRFFPHFGTKTPQKGTFLHGQKQPDFHSITYCIL